VLLSLANHADHTTGRCYPTVQTISDESSVPVRTVYRVLAALVRNGYLLRERTRDLLGRQRANSYWLVLDRDRSEEIKDWKWTAASEAESDEMDDAEGDVAADDGDVHDDEPDAPWHQVNRLPLHCRRPD
jgi:hypothetical protein